MAITKKYSLYAVQLDDDADVLISGITSQSLSPQSQVDQEITTEVYPRWYALTGQNPNGQFGTYHLATALANIGLAGLSISGLTTGFALWLQLHADEATRAGATSHRKYMMTAGMVIPRTLRVSHGGSAVLTSSRSISGSTPWLRAATGTSGPRSSRSNRLRR